MKHLWLIRHATAIQGDFSLADFDRTLESSGVQEAKKTGAFILKSGIVPEFIFCSSSKRTIETADLIGSSINKIIQVKATPDLYNSSFQTIQKTIQGVDPKVLTLALVGHNPGISQLATALSVSGSFQMAPSSAVCLEFLVDDWKELKAGKGKELFYFYP